MGVVSFTSVRCDRNRDIDLELFGCWLSMPWQVTLKDVLAVSMPTSYLAVNIFFFVITTEKSTLLTPVLQEVEMLGQVLIYTILAGYESKEKLLLLFSQERLNY